MCPECSEIFRFSDTFIRHDCAVEKSPRLQQRKTQVRQKAKREFERAIKLCEAVTYETVKRKHISGPVLKSKRARLRRRPSQPSDSEAYNTKLAVLCDENISFVANNITAPLPDSHDIEAIVVANNYNNAMPLSNNNDSFDGFIGNNQNNTTPLLHGDGIGAFFATNNYNNAAHLLHNDSDIGHFFAAGDNNNTAHLLHNESDIGAFFAAGENSNAVHLLADDDDIGMFFAANQGSMNSVSTSNISVPIVPNNYRER